MKHVTYNKKYKIKSTFNTIIKMWMYNIKKEVGLKIAQIGFCLNWSLLFKTRLLQQCW